MRRNFKHLSLLLLFVVLLSEVSWGCSLAVKPVTKFDPSEYIFIGEVIDIVGPRQPKYVIGDAWGIAVRVEGEVFLPKKPVNNFEVFPYKLESDCSWVGWSKEELLKSYPIGSRVRVIAREEIAVERLSVNIRLSPISLGIATNDYDAEVLVNREYDYKTYDRRDYSLPDFELRKDLLRLSKTRSEARRIAILERLVYYPPLIIDYSAIVKNHIRNRRVIRVLKEKREDWTWKGNR